MIVQILLIFLLSNNVNAQEQVNSCVICHSDKKVEYAQSIHSQRGIKCTDCHGGDASIMDLKSMDPQTGFKAKPKRKEIPELCASCHSDVKLMTPYGLITDQFEHYKVSQHGVKLFSENDESVAVCTDCHGQHNILAHDDPQSSVYKLNVAQTCARCHSDTKLMAKYGIPADQFGKYKESAHGIALLKNKNLAAPNCARCHGTHGAIPPGVSEVSDVCGQCHKTTREYFNKSPHKEAMKKMKLSECVTCHGYHGIMPPDAGLFDTACAKCHTADSNEFAAGQKIKSMIEEAGNYLEKTRALLSEAETRGFYVESEKTLLEDAKTNLIRVLPVQHTLSPGDVEEFTGKAKGAADEVRDSINEMFRQNMLRKSVVYVIWFVIILIVLILWMKIRHLSSERAH
jgi:hypothetical protein